MLLIINLKKFTTIIILKTMSKFENIIKLIKSIVCRNNDL